MGDHKIRKNGMAYSISEEIANGITHGFGSLLAIAGCVLLIIFAAFSHDVWKIVSSSIYGASMILLFQCQLCTMLLQIKQQKKYFKYSTIHRFFFDCWILYTAYVSLIKRRLGLDNFRDCLGSCYFRYSI